MAIYDDPGTQAANTRFVRKTMREPLLSREVEYELANNWRDKGDEKSLHRLINAYARLAVSIAGKFRNYGLPFGDLAGGYGWPHAGSQSVRSCSRSSLLHLCVFGGYDRQFKIFIPS